MTPQGGGKETMKLKQNIKVLGLRKLNNHKLTARMRQAREILKIKKRQLQSTQEKIKFRDINKAYRIHGVSCLLNKVRWWSHRIQSAL